MEPHVLREHAARPNCPVDTAKVLRQAADDLVRHRAAVEALCETIDAQGEAVELLRKGYPYVAGLSHTLAAEIDACLARVDNPESQ